MPEEGYEWKRGFQTGCDKAAVRKNLVVNGARDSVNLCYARSEECSLLIYASTVLFSKRKRAAVGKLFYHKPLKRLQRK